MIDSKILENSGFIVSGLVVGSGEEQDMKYKLKLITLRTLF